MSDPTPELNAALAKAQADFGAIKKEKTARTGSYTYSYASLDAFLDECRPKLAAQGIAILQLFEVTTSDVPAMRTELRHTSGEVISSVFPFQRMPETDQQLGSMLTYLRRYTLAAMLGVAAEEDDDGAQASEAKPAARKPRAKKDEPIPPSKEQLDAFYKPAGIQESQLQKLGMLFRQKGIEDRDKRLAFVSQALGRPVESSKDLTKGEASMVIAQLARYDPDDPQTFPFPEAQLS